MEFITLYHKAKWLVNVGDVVKIKQSPLPYKVTYKSECNSDGGFWFEVEGGQFDKMYSDEISSYLPYNIYKKINDLETEIMKLESGE